MFSRRSVLEPKVVDLNELVRDNEKMLHRLIGEDVQLTTDLEAPLDPVTVDPGSVGQVIMNLAVNARDAMPTGGRLRIETRAVLSDDDIAAAMPEATPPGPYVLLAISDTGVGMTPEVRSHLFEPFFTTKEPGKGTGLGLATVYGIVKQSGGFIFVDSDLGRGAAFKIYFPAATGVAAASPSPSGRRSIGGAETILLVEDEDAVRSMLHAVLQRVGYTVLDASRGAEALRLAGEERPIDLIVTDVVMPEMGGRDLVERVTRLRPGIKVLYLSGYADDAIVRHGVHHPEVAFLPKPFSVAALTNKVRQVLDEPSG